MTRAGCRLSCGHAAAGSKLQAPVSASARDPASYELYQERYERSRETSLFNQRLYARRNRPAALVLLVGHTRYRRTRDGIEVCERSARALQQALRDDIGLSDECVARWIASGALEASMAPALPR